MSACTERRSVHTVLHTAATACREEFPAHWVPPLSAPLWLSVPVLILSRTLK